MSAKGTEPIQRQLPPQSIHFITLPQHPFMNSETILKALHDWFSKKGITAQEVTLAEFAGDAAHYSSEAGFDHWRFFEFKTPPPQEYDITLGISNDGEAATFTPVADDDSFLDFDSFAGVLESIPDFITWLEKNMR